MQLIDVLRRQKVSFILCPLCWPSKQKFSLLHFQLHLEAAHVLQYTEDEFLKTLDWKPFGNEDSRSMVVNNPSGWFLNPLAAEVGISVGGMEVEMTAIGGCTEAFFALFALSALAAAICNAPITRSFRITRSLADFWVFFIFILSIIKRFFKLEIKYRLSSYLILALMAFLILPILDPRSSKNWVIFASKWR